MADFKVIYGNIFDSKANYLVNPVNCIGVMGAGLAKQFKERYPAMFERYKKLCDDGELLLRNICVDYESGVIFFPTKRHWRDRSRLDDITVGLRRLAMFLSGERRNHLAVAVPLVGAGLGGLDKFDVLAAIWEELAFVPNTTIEVYCDGNKSDYDGDFRLLVDTMSGTFEL